MSAALAGRRVLVLRAPAQAAALSDRVRALGGEPVEAPVLRIEPGDLPALDAAVVEAASGSVALLCLTSPNGVDALADAVVRTGTDPAALRRVERIACVGRGTAGRLDARLGLDADLLPDTATTEALGQAVPPGRGRALLVRADRANPVLDELLTARGYTCVPVTAYHTRFAEQLPAPVLADLEAGSIDLVAFGSSSSVEAFTTLVAGRPWQAAVVSIGPVTSATCRQQGLAVAGEADPHDLDGLVDALVRAARDLDRGAGPWA